MKITILKRYDINGCWTHDIDAKIGSEYFEPHPSSMWQISEKLDIDEMKESLLNLEMEIEKLTEENRKMRIRITQLNKERWECLMCQRGQCLGDGQ